MRHIFADPPAQVPDAVPDSLVRYHFPTGEMVGTAAAAIGRRLGAWDGSEGPRARLVIAPGVVAVERRDLNRAERTRERAVQRRLKGEPALAREDDDEEDDGEARTRGTIREWSAKSRARMVRTICTLDLSPLLPDDKGRPAMLTLTLGEWETVAPTAAEYKRLVRVFRDRERRAWGAQPETWKAEFQRRGAPHLHRLQKVPYGVAFGSELPEGEPQTREAVLAMFAARTGTRGKAKGAPVGAGMGYAEWARYVWADIVGYQDPRARADHESHGAHLDFAEGLRATDPRRVAVYFTKHSSANFGDKEYQNVAPLEWADSIGRLWGYAGLRKADTYVEVPMEDAIWYARFMRRWARAQGTTRQERVWRGSPESGEGRFRKVRRRVSRMRGGAGFLCVNDGASFTWALARAVEVRAEGVGKVATS